MKEMSLQHAREYWTYLHGQAELKKLAFLDTPYGSPYKDEMRAEGETYQGLAETFVGNFEYSITSAEDILHGLTAAQAAGYLGYLGYLDRQVVKFKAVLAKTRRNRQEPLATAQGMEYQRVKSIYNEMENLSKCQIQALENSRKSFISILQES